ncbi:MAG: aldehyde dehydrogenase family protein [Acidimicrobiales bacterium]
MTQPAVTQSTQTTVTQTTATPTTGTATVGRDGDATVDEVDGAVRRAEVAQVAWGRLGVAERARHMLGVRSALLERMDEVVGVIVAETGKLSAEAVVNEVLVTCEQITWYARHAPRLLAPERVGTGLLAHKRAERCLEPLGVVGVISPWNYPLVLAMGPLSTALFAGNTAVLKPSELTPGVGLVIGELFAAMAEHSDIVQVVTGGGAVGEALVRSGVAKVCFTGSVSTGKAVMRAAAETLTPVLLELGGKDPMIVCADADIERAARAAVWGAFTNCGQTCIAVERAYVVDDVYDAFVHKVVELTGRLHQGQGAGSDIGAMTHQGQVDVVDAHLADALAKGASVACGGRRVTVGGRPSFEPTVVLGVDHTMLAMQEETFGPLLPIMRVADTEEALALANDSPYGLSASVFGRDRRVVDGLVDGLRAGSVCVNDVMVCFAIPGLAFGGVKASGVGVTHGADGLREFTQVKSVARDRLGLRREPMWLPLPRRLEGLARLAMRLRYRRGQTGAP